MAKKKKTVHWTKLPRPELVSMVKRLELQCAKLKLQLAEANNFVSRAAADNGYRAVTGEAQACELFGVVHIKQDEVLSGAALDDVLERRAPAKMPWE